MIQNTTLKMSEDLRTKVEQLSPFQRKYLEYRAKGLKQWDAAKKAGSEAADKEALGRVGYNIEQMKGAKEYVNFLIEQRAKNAVVDEIEILEKLRANYEAAHMSGKIADANKAVELMGMMIGIFGTKQTQASNKPSQQDGATTKNDLRAFKNEDDDQGEDKPVEDRLSKVQRMMAELRGIK